MAPTWTIRVSSRPDLGFILPEVEAVGRLVVAGDGCPPKTSLVGNRRRRPLGGISKALPPLLEVLVADFDLNLDDPGFVLALFRLLLGLSWGISTGRLSRAC